MLKAFKYRIYPTPAQAEMINKTIGCCRFVYNLALETKIAAYRSSGVSITGYDLQKQLTMLKKDVGWLTEVDSNTLNEAILNMDSAFKNFFSGNGFPKFKKKRDSGSFTCKCNKREVDWGRSTISIPKIQDIPAILSRRFDGEIRRIFISKTVTGKYFASVLVKVLFSNPEAPPTKNAIGIDLGIADFATLSTGEKISNPRHLQAELKRLKVLQRRASRKKKGSQNKRKANLKVAILHEKITNQRKDFLHKLSTKLISDNQTDTICVEDLQLKTWSRTAV